MLPHRDGLAVARALRGRGLQVPILMLTARDAVVDRVAGLDSGADDYLVKPFATDELLARVRALLRRHAPEEVLVLADLTFDPATRSVQRGGGEVILTPREADLLELLLRNARRVVSREQAVAQIWHGATRANTVDRAITNLRRKLGEPSLIETVRGVGFVIGR
jgi:two-component system response regulator MprA